MAATVKWFYLPKAGVEPRGDVAASKALVETLVRSGRTSVVRMPLAQQALEFRPAAQRFLHSLGRKEGETYMQITIHPPVKERLAQHREPFFFGHLGLPAGEIQRLLDNAAFSYVQGHITPDQCRLRPDSDLSAKDFSEAQLMMISGDVYVVFRAPQNHGLPWPRARPVFCCSIPGINFAYSPEDRARFVLPSNQIAVNEAVPRMKLIFAHVLKLMADNGVLVPVLSAIGCGAFKGSFRDVPVLYARALYEVLGDPTMHPVVGKFQFVAMCLPDFGDGNFALFSDEFQHLQDNKLPLNVPVVMLQESMVALADVLTAEYDLKAGFLNPSDAQAIRQGYIGMYWDGGHVALEELLAMQTTLLLHHKGVNPELYVRPPKAVDLSALESFVTRDVPIHTRK